MASTWSININFQWRRMILAASGRPQSRAPSSSLAANECSYCAAAFADSDALVQHELDHFETPASSATSARLPCHYCPADFKCWSHHF